MVSNHVEHCCRATLVFCTEINYVLLTVFSKNNGPPPKELILYCELLDVIWIHDNITVAISFSIFWEAAWR